MSRKKYFPFRRRGSECPTSSLLFYKRGCQGKNTSPSAGGEASVRHPASCSIKGDVKEKILPLPPEGKRVSDIQPPVDGYDAICRSVVCHHRISFHRAGRSRRRSRALQAAWWRLWANHGSI